MSTRVNTHAPTPLVEDLKCLTSLRFFAALFLLMHHLRGTFGIPADFTTLPLGSGVSFFFLLSGFILSHVYKDLSDKPSRNRFWMARIARLWPIQLLCLILTAYFVGDFTNIQTALGYNTRLVANVFLMQAWYPDFRLIFSFNSVSWSISVELFFYLLFPFLLIGFNRNGIYKLLLSGLMVVGMITLSAVLVLKPYASAAEGGLTSTALLYISPLTRLFEFVLGMMAFQIWAWLRCVYGDVSALWVALEVLSMTALVAFLIYWNPVLNTVYVYGGYYSAEWFAQSGVCFIAAPIIIAFASGQGPIGRFLRHNVFVFLGNISFSLYMCHQMIQRYILHKTSLSEFLTNEQLLAVYLVTVLLFSWLLWTFEMSAKRNIMRVYDNMPTRSSWVRGVR